MYVTATVFNTSRTTTFNTSTTTVTRFNTTFGTSRGTGESRNTGTSRNTAESRNTGESRSTTTTHTYGTSRNTTTVFSTTASLQTRYRTVINYFKANFACGQSVSSTIYRLVNNNSSAVVTTGDNLYTNSSGTTALTSGNWGITSNAMHTVCYVAQVGSGGLVTGVYDCSCGSGGGDFPDPVSYTHLRAHET